MHKNIEGNLLVLCDKCHREHHQSEGEMKVREVVGGLIIDIE